MLHESHIQSAYVIANAVLLFFWCPHAMVRPGAQVEIVYLYPKPVGFRKSIDGLAALVELDINFAVFDPGLCLPQQAAQRGCVTYWSNCRMRSRRRTMKH